MKEYCWVVTKARCFQLERERVFVLPINRFFTSKVIKNIFQQQWWNDNTEQWIPF